MACAKELFFQEDQIVMFPSTMGFTGEVHRTMGLKYDNAHGIIIQKKRPEPVEDEFEN
jgi:hypothetical protein